MKKISLALIFVACVAIAWSVSGAKIAEQQPVGLIGTQIAEQQPVGLLVTPH